MSDFVMFIRDFYVQKAIQSKEKEVIKMIEKMIDERIKMWESDIKGKPSKERYYGVSGCVLKELEELKQKFKGDGK